MPVTVCDVCPARFPDRQSRDDKTSHEKLWDHMLDEHFDWLTDGKTEGLTVDEWRATHIA